MRACARLSPTVTSERRPWRRAQPPAPSPQSVKIPPLNHLSPSESESSAPILPLIHPFVKELAQIWRGIETSAVSSICHPRRAPPPLAVPGSACRGSPTCAAAMAGPSGAQSSSSLPVTSPALAMAGSEGFGSAPSSSAPPWRNSNGAASSGVRRVAVGEEQRRDKLGCEEQRGEVSSEKLSGPRRLPAESAGVVTVPHEIQNEEASNQLSQSMAPRHATEGITRRTYAEVLRSSIREETCQGRPIPERRRRVMFSSTVHTATFHKQAAPCIFLGREAARSGRHYKADPKSILRSSYQEARNMNTFAARSSTEKRACKTISSPEAQRSWAEAGLADPPRMPTEEANLFMPPWAHLAQAERSLAFKDWARGRCYRCLAPDHQVRSCRYSLRCIRCHRTGHRERHCRMRTPLVSPQIQSHKKPQLSQSPQSLQWSQQSVEKVANHICYDLHASKYLDPKSVGTSLLESLLPELEKLFDSLLKKVMHPIREDLATIKLWLARIATKLDLHEQDKELMLTPSFAGLFGPCSPTRLRSTSSLLDSLAAAHNLVDPLEAKDTEVVTTDSVADQSKPKDPAVTHTYVGPLACEAETMVEPSLKIPHEAPLEQNVEVDDVVIVENASEDETLSYVHATTVGSNNDAKRDDSYMLSSSPISTKRRCGRHHKSSRRRSSRFAPCNIFRDLGFLKKNGKLDKDKFEAFADLLKELLPHDLLLSLLSLEGSAFWKAMAKILSVLV